MTGRGRPARSFARGKHCISETAAAAVDAPVIGSRLGIVVVIVVGFSRCKYSSK